MALTQLTKVDGGGISTTSDYRVGIITASKFVGPFDGTAGNFSGVVTATSANFTGNVTIGGTLTYEDVTNIDSVGIITARDGIDCNGDLDVDGHTNLDNVNIVGVTTTTGNLNVTDGRILIAQSTAPQLRVNSSAGDGASTRLIFGLATGNNNFINGAVSNDACISAPQEIKFGIGANLRFRITDTYLIPNVDLIPSGNNVRSLGISNYRWSDLYSVDANISGDLDVDGHTNLDNVSVSGVTTFTGITTAGVAYATDFKAPDGNTNGFYAGNSDDLHLFHNGADSYIENDTGNLTFTTKNNNNIIFKTTSSETERLLIRGNDGFIGINTTTPTKLVTIKADAPFLRLEAKDTSDKRLDLQVSSAGIATISAEQSSQQLSFKTTGGEAIRITSDGKVGINQSSPSAMLQVDYDEGNSQVGLRLRAYNASGSKTWQLSEINGNTGVFTIRNATNSINSLSIDATGKVGIGSDNPGSQLEVYGTGTSTVVEVNGTGRYRGFEIHESGTRKAYFFHDATNNEAIVNTAEPTLQFAIGDTPVMRINSNGDLVFKDGSAQGNSLSSKIIVTDSSDNVQYEIGMLATSNEDLYFSNSRNSNIRFRTQATTRWKIDGTGHLLPETAGAVNIGSASAEIGDVYIADDKKLYLGSSQDVEIYHSSGNVTMFDSPNNRQVQLKGDGGLLIRASGNQNIANFVQSGVTLYHSVGNAYTARFVTTSTGITVTGEVAATQDYPSLKPTLDLNFAGTANLDPRITFTREGTASYIGRDGLIKFAAQNEPRFDHDPITRECKGLLIEEQRKNIHPYSERLDKWTVESGGSVTANTHISPAGDLTADSINGTQSGSSAYRTFPLTNNATYTFSFFMKYVSGNQNILISIGDAALTRSNTTFNTSTGALVSNSGGAATVNDVVEFPNGWYRYSITRTATSTSSGFIDFNHTSSTASVVAVWGAQVEEGAFTTSYIRTIDNVNVIRGADECYIDGQDFLDFYNQTEGTMISSHSILPDIPSTRNLYTYQISPTGATAYAPLRLLDKNGSYGNSLTAASVYNNGTVFLVQPSGSPVTVPGKKMLTAVSFKKDDYDASFNGENVQSDGSGDLYTADHISIGYYKPSPQAYLNGHIQRLIYYPFKLTNNQLKTITS